MLNAKDIDIVLAARKENAVIMSKDRDFVDLLARLGAPPQIVWVTCGNTSNDYLKSVLLKVMPEVIGQLSEGALLLETTDKR